ncbi:bifunctional DNA primase/polymerase [Legionella sainthelensi]|uniref:bifunctional DNA primase/polymerase n=1 Tax=Legionella sainthelensi TaxID=28087 RepID=UPI000E205333|nr:bifunctional DNA primase/polymerase [Legionella sainthelensi]
MTRRNYEYGHNDFQILTAKKNYNKNKTPAIMQEVNVYWDRGWGIHSLNKQKCPLLKDWQYKVTISAIFMQWSKEWPWVNVGIVSANTSSLIIFDVDGNNIKSLELLVPPTVVTAREHYYINFPSSLKSTTLSGLLPGIDTRDRGGYITDLPSIHETSHQYYWNNPLYEKLPAPAAGLIERLTHTQNLTQMSLIKHRGSSSYAYAALKNEANEFAMTMQGKRNMSLKQAALDAGLSSNEIEKNLCSGLYAGMQYQGEVFHG